MEHRAEDTVAQPVPHPMLEIRIEDDTALIVVSGGWRLGAGGPWSTPVGLLERGATRRVAIDASSLAGWDSSLVTFVHALARDAAQRGVEVDLTGLPAGARALVELALAVPPRILPHTAEDDALTARVGRITLKALYTAGDAVDFLGEVSLAFVALLRGRARFRARDLLQAFETTGPSALAIVALVSLLIGAVLAFVGAVQLRQFGALLYVANLVGVGITRELGPLMTGIVMAGRTGASFAATLGTMTVNEEVDALRVQGFAPAEFLVLPRILGTALMMPALVAYADALGLMGGLLVGVTLLDVDPTQFLDQVRSSVSLDHVLVGLVKAAAFGVVVAVTGTYYGIRCGRSAEAVGQATARSVVMGIVLVVVVDAVFTVLLHVIGV